MNKCDKCNEGAGVYTVNGWSELTRYDLLCAICCGNWCLSKGDLAGARKFGVLND
jgi:hypothetical protein